MASKPVERFDLTETDRLLIGHLRRCSFPIASFARRFARNMGNLLDMASGRISARERACVCSLVYLFRRQIPNPIVAKAALYLAELQAAYQLDAVAHPLPTPVSNDARRAADDLFAKAAP